MEDMTCVLQEGLRFLWFCWYVKIYYAGVQGPTVRLVTKVTECALAWDADLHHCLSVAEAIVNSPFHKVRVKRRLHA